MVALYDMIISCPPLFNFTFKVLTYKADAFKFRTFRIRLSDSRHTHSFYVTHTFQTQTSLDAPSLQDLHFPPSKPFHANNLADSGTEPQLTESLPFRLFVFRALPLCLFSLCALALLFHFQSRNFTHKSEAYNKAYEPSNGSIQNCQKRATDSFEVYQINHQSSTTQTNYCENYFKMTYPASGSSDKLILGSKLVKCSRVSTSFYVLCRLLLSLTCTLTFASFLLHALVLLRHRHLLEHLSLVAKDVHNTSKTTTPPPLRKRCFQQPCYQQTIKRQKKTSDYVYERNRSIAHKLAFNALSYDYLASNFVRNKNCTNSCEKLLLYDESAARPMVRKQTSGDRSTEAPKKPLSGIYNIQTFMGTTTELTCHNYLEKMIGFVKRQTLSLTRSDTPENSKKKNLSSVLNGNRRLSVLRSLEKYNERMISDHHKAFRALINNPLEVIKKLKNDALQRINAFSKRFKPNRWAFVRKDGKLYDDKESFTSLNDFVIQLPNLASLELLMSSIEK